MLHEIDIEAVVDRLPGVNDFVNECLEGMDCSPKALMQVELAVEEIFMNIASYAYTPNTGRAVVRVETADAPPSVTITFIDRGVPYDPLAKRDPDTTLSADEREIGGLGIFMVKKTMDAMTYEYKDGQNILTIKKNL